MKVAFDDVIGSFELLIVFDTDPLARIKRTSAFLCRVPAKAEYEYIFATYGPTLNYLYRINNTCSAHNTHLVAHAALVLIVHARAPNAHDYCTSPLHMFIAHAVCSLLMPTHAHIICIAHCSCPLLVAH